MVVALVVTGQWPWSRGGHEVVAVVVGRSRGGGSGLEVVVAVVGWWGWWGWSWGGRSSHRVVVTVMAGWSWSWRGGRGCGVLMVVTGQWWSWGGCCRCGNVGGGGRGWSLW